MRRPTRVGFVPSNARRLTGGPGGIYENSSDSRSWFIDSVRPPGSIKLSGSNDRIRNGWLLLGSWELWEIKIGIYEKAQRQSIRKSFVPSDPRVNRGIFVSGRCCIYRTGAQKSGLEKNVRNW